MPNVENISAQEFSSLYQNKQQTLTIIDLRTPEEVAEFSLENTIKLPIQVLTQESFISALNKANHKNSDVYLLCKSGKRAHMAVSLLPDYEDKKLVIIEGGLMAMP